MVQGMFLQMKTGKLISNYKQKNLKDIINQSKDYRVKLLGMKMQKPSNGRILHVSIEDSQVL